MTNITSILRKGLLAAALAGAAFGASAAPTTYHVNVDTSSLTGGTFLEFGFSGSAPVASTTATVAHLNSAGLTVADSLGGTVDADGSGFVLSNSAYSYVDYVGAISGMFSFDLTFSDGFMADTGFESLFSVSVLDSDYFTVAGGANFATFKLTATDGISTVFTPGLGNATLDVPSAVPEPTQLLLMLTALAMMGAMLKRRQA